MTALKETIDLPVDPDEVLALWGALVERQRGAEQADNTVLAQRLADLRHRLEAIVEDKGGHI